MKKLSAFLLILFLLISTTAFSADSAESLTPESIKSFKKHLALTPQLKSLSNALKNQQFADVFLNREILRNHNTRYTYEVETGDVTNQKRTGRCWLYAGINAVRPNVVERVNMKDFEFSLSYLFFWDKMEKANFFLEKAIRRADLDIRSVKYRNMLSGPMGDGGYWQNFVDLIKKYGCVPIAAMPEVASNENSRAMVRNLTYLLRNYAYELKELKTKGKTIKQLRIKKQHYLANIYKVLALHLGEPVESFPFRYYTKDENAKEKKDKKKLTPYETYTPKSFAEKFVLQDVDDYIMFANWPGRKFNTLYEWESSNNVIEGTRLTFINLPMDEIKAMMLESIKNNTAVNFSADVGKQLERKKGIMHADMYRFDDVYGIPFSRDKKRNSMLGNINSTHAMVFMGVDIADGKPLKWKVENSWGTKNGDKGFYAMYDNWVNLYVVRVVIDKRFVPERIQKILKSKAVVIPELEPEQ
ncbi:MAG: hypothetical protein GY765_33475 [bacterium]|nr:hypothetical protein [bacterium]